MGFYQKIGIGLDALVLDIQEWINDRTAPAPPKTEPEPATNQGVSKGLGEGFDWL